MKLLPNGALTIYILL